MRPRHDASWKDRKCALRNLDVLLISSKTDGIYLETELLNFPSSIEESKGINCSGIAVLNTHRMHWTSLQCTSKKADQNQHSSRLQQPLQLLLQEDAAKLCKAQSRHLQAAQAAGSCRSQEDQ